MKKLNFVKSVTAGIVGLTLLSGCTGVMEKKGMHKCSDRNKCSGKKAESHSCKANSCSGKKMEKETNSCSANSCKASKKEIKETHSCKGNSCSSKKSK